MGSEVVRTWFGRGSDVVRMWVGRVLRSGADSLAELKGKWFPAKLCILKQGEFIKIGDSHKSVRLL